METATGEFAEAIGRSAAAFGLTLGDREIQRLGDYYALVMKWNARLHLVAPCSPQEFATRHVLESLLLLKHLPLNAAIVDWDQEQACRRFPACWYATTSLLP